MNTTENDILNELKKHATDTRTFLSNKMKPERERSVCRAFLRAIGVSFEESEIIAPTEEPADVAFRDARFQIRDLLEPDRRRGSDWKEMEKKYENAESLNKLLEPYSSPTNIELDTLAHQITVALSVKAHKYGRGCSKIDALVYVDLKNRYLPTGCRFPNLDTLISQGWRSASFLFPPYGVVLFANSSAPELLKTYSQCQKAEWQSIDTLFEP